MYIITIVLENQCKFLLYQSISSVVICSVGGSP